MKNIKLIFIDIDGVLNNFHFYKITPHYTWDLFDPISVSLLNQIIKAYDVDLILSSDWRKTYGVKETQKVFSKNKINKKITGYISSSCNKEEGIKMYLEFLYKKSNNVHFVVLDDEKINVNNLIQTNPKYGLTISEYKKINKIFKSV